jgi:Phage terminase, small subunit
MPTSATSAEPVEGLALLETLPPKQQRFCREYIIDFNAKQAMVRAGYSKNGAAVEGSRLLTKPNIQSVIQALVLDQTRRLDLTAERVMTEVARVSFFNPKRMFDEDGKLKKPKDWHIDDAPAVASYNWKKGEISFHPKVPALTLAARIVKIVDSDAVPINMQGNFVVVCPADATPEQWSVLAAAQVAQPPAGQITHVNGSPPSINGHNGTPHAGNGDGH